ncbi:MAG: presqualene diphosphate synthase HpnD [Elusimicrobia bacterium]|nr:presqualene diphosphate synthase HpnD [Elusimicrobiota bacterium]
MTGATAAQGSNFYAGFLFLPRDKRRALTAVYAYCRMIDDIVDSGHLPEAQAQKMLDFWREEVERLFSDRPTHSLSQELARHVKAFDLPKEPFLDLIAGCEMDLKKKRYETFADLEKYLYGVAVTVGLLCVRIFGYEKTSEEDIREYARNMGYAVQLTNILRDVGQDLEQGRIYLPQEELAAAGYTMDDLLHRRHTPAWTNLMRGQHERAKIHYQRARNILHPADRPGMLPAEVMGRVYEGILDEIKALQYHVFFHKVSLPFLRKLRLAIDAIRFSYGWP